MPLSEDQPRTAGLLPPELSTLAPGELFVNETFSSIQGESTYAGRPCFFIRLAGCHLRCTWCDTEYAFYEGRRRRCEELLEEARASGLRLVEVTGGEPLLQKNVYELLRRLCDAGFEVLLETSGAVPIGGVDPRVHRIVDWKCPGSGMADRNLPSVIDALKPGDELKFVVASRRDYEWARSTLASMRSRRPDIGTSIPVHISPACGRLFPEEVARWMLEDRLDARLNLQLHKVLWPERERGV